jgi:DNA invertase Pin-like site-specific DNA recombinase
MADTAEELVKLFGERDLQFWIGFAACGLRKERRLRRVVSAQRATIARLQAENEALRQERRPPGGRPPLAEETVARIERELERGGGSLRQVGQRLGVSHMTVKRVLDRMAERQRANVTLDTVTDAAGEVG